MVIYWNIIRFNLIFSGNFIECSFKYIYMCNGFIIVRDKSFIWFNVDYLYNGLYFVGIEIYIFVLLCNFFVVKKCILFVRLFDCDISVSIVFIFLNFILRLFLWIMFDFRLGNEILKLIEIFLFWFIVDLKLVILYGLLELNSCLFCEIVWILFWISFLIFDCFVVRVVSL